LFDFLTKQLIFLHQY